MKRILPFVGTLAVLALFIGLISVYARGQGNNKVASVLSDTDDSPAFFQGGLPIITPTPIPTSTRPVPSPTATPVPQITAAEIEVVAQYGGTVNAVALSGEFAYVGVGPRLVILSTSNPNELIKRGQTDVLPGIVLDIVVTETYAYVAVGDGGIQAIDITQPDKPVVAGQFDTPGYATNIDIKGSFAFVADAPVREADAWAYGSLRIIDISDPANMVEVGAFDTPGWENAVVVNGGYAYVADGDGGVRIIDVIDPANPVEVGFFDTTGSAQTVVLDIKQSASHLYVVSSSGSAQIVDLANPVEPQVLGNLTTSDRIIAVEVVGNRAYAVGGSGGLTIFDVSNPAAPVQIGVFDTTAEGVSVMAGRAYLFGPEIGLRTVDVTEPGAMTEVSHYDTLGYVQAVSVEGNKVYAVGNGSFLVFNRNAGTNALDHAKTYALTDSRSHISASGNLIFAGQAPRWDGSSWQEGSVQVIDVSDTTQLHNVGAPIPIKGARGLAMSGKHLFVADESEGLKVFDVEDAGTVQETGSYDGALQDARDVAVAGNRAYVADYLNGLHILDVNDPNAPKEVGHVPMHMYMTAVAATGTHVFVGLKADHGTPENGRWGQGGLRVLNTSELALSHYQFSHYDTPGEIEDMAVSGDRIYVADGDGGLLVLRYQGSQ